MELFERVKYLIQDTDKGANGKDSLADKIGVNAHTLRGYLSKKREDNLWPLLGRILAAYPEVSRNWLYFGQGEPQLANEPGNTKVQTAPGEMERARQRIADLEGQVAALKTVTEALKGQAEALKGQVAALNQVIALQAQKDRSANAPLGNNTDVRISGHAAPVLQKPIETMPGQDTP